jgi:glycosyltransferase involved in cell wall biosynthesis
MFSIITITHNRRALLEKAIASVLSQSITDLEHIVVDDGSTDGTASLIAQINDPRLKYLSLPHSGHLAKLRNAGLEQARGELIAFLDSDDLFEAGCLHKLLTAYEDPAIKTIIANAFVLSDKGKTLLFKKDLLQGQNNLLAARLKNDFVICSCCFSFRNLPGSPNRFNEQMRYGDSDLYIRRLIDGGVQIIREPLATITKHGSNMSYGSRENPSFIPAYTEALETLENLKAGGHVSSWLYARTASLYFYQLGNELRGIERRKEARQNYRKAFLKFPLKLKALVRYLFYSL